MDLPKIVAIDTETTGLDWRAQFLTIGAAYRGESGEIVREVKSVTMADLFTEVTPIPALRAWLKKLCRQSDLIAMHNTTFDLSYLMRDGFLDESDVIGKLFDTLLIARMTDKHDRVSLDSLAKQYNLGKPEWFAMKRKRKNLQSLAPETVMDYNADDCELTLVIAEHLYKLGLPLYGHQKMCLESDYCRVMAKVRLRGKPVNMPFLGNLIDQYQSRQNHLFRMTLQLNGIEGASNHQSLIKFLAKEGVEFTALTPKGAPSVDENALKDIMIRYQNQPKIIRVVDAVLDAREVEKRLSTWLVPIYSHHAVNGRVHANYTVAGAFTYRLTANEPGIQAMPKLGLWGDHISCDYSTAEMRLAAMYAKDNQLARIFEQGADLHLETARLMYGDDQAAAMRKYAKQANFAALYFSGANTLSIQSGLPFADAKAILTNHKRQFATLHGAANSALDIWKDRGWVELLCGKRIYLPDYEKTRAYKAFNNIIQGGVAGIVGRAMMALDAAGYPMIGQTHDEITFDPWVNFDEEEVRSIMGGVVPPKIDGRTDPRIVMEIECDYNFVTEGADNESGDRSDIGELSDDSDLQPYAVGENEHDF